MIKLGEAVGLYNYQQKITSIAGGTETMIGPPVRQNLIAVITEATVVNFTLATRKMLIGKMDPGDVEHVVKVLPTDKHHTVELQGEMILLEDEKPFGRIYNVDVGSELYCTFHGLIYKRRG